MAKEFYDLGDLVLCDLCNKDYTNSDESGGFSFSRKAVCPDCAAEFRKIIVQCNEEHLISSECPKGMSFADYVRKILREGQGGYISLVTGEHFDEWFKAMEDE